MRAAKDRIKWYAMWYKSRTGPLYSNDDDNEEYPISEIISLLDKALFLFLLRLQVPSGPGYLFPYRLAQQLQVDVLLFFFFIFSTKMMKKRRRKSCLGNSHTTLFVRAEMRSRQALAMCRLPARFYGTSAT